MGESVNRKEIVLKEDMGYVDNLIVWIGKHPYLSAAGLILTFFGGAAAYGQLYKSKDSDGTAATTVITADSLQPLAPTPAPTVILPVNGSAEEEYHFSPDIIVHGSDVYKEKIQKALDFIKKTDIDEYNEVMLYLEVVRDGPDNTVGKGVYTIPELVLDRGGPSVLIHEKEHAKQMIEPTYSSYYKGKSGWYSELDAVKKQVDWEAKAYNYTEEQKLQRFNIWMKAFEGAYPKEYAEFISEN